MLAKQILYQKQGDFPITKGSVVGAFNAGECFVTSFDIIDPAKMNNVACNLMSLSENNDSKISIWFQPGTTILDIRGGVVCTHEEKILTKSFFSVSENQCWFNGI